MERHELEDINREAKDIEHTLRWEAFRPDAIFQVKECLENNGDLVDLLNELDLNYDEYDSLTNSEINEIVTKAVLNMKATA